MKKILTLIMLMGAMTAAEAQTMVLNLDSCRAMALRNNKQINASKLKKDVATNLKKSARTKYLPKVDAMGGYEWFSKEISLLNDGQKSAFSNLGSNIVGGITGNANDVMADLVSKGMLTPEQAQKIGGLLNEKGSVIQQQGNAIGQSVVDAFRTDTRNMWAGSVMLRQPIYMGGAILAANKIAGIDVLADELIAPPGTPAVLSHHIAIVVAAEVEVFQGECLVALLGCNYGQSLLAGRWAFLCHRLACIHRHHRNHGC